MTKKASRVARKRHQGRKALESTVDFLAVFLFGLGCLLAAVVLGVYTYATDFSLFMAGVIHSSLIVLGAFINLILFRCLAEHLRLQKKIAHLPFEGEITGPREESFWACGNCGQVLHSENKCDECGATIVGDFE